MTSSTDKELAVLVNDQVLGTVSQGRSGRLSFEYDEDWRGNVDAFPLSLSMPLALKTHPHDVIHAYLNGLLPDNEDVKRGIARHFGLASATPFRLVGAIGEDLAGAVQIVPPSGTDALKKRQGVVPISEAVLGAYLDSLRRTPGMGPISEDAGRFSLAGAQAKKAVYWVNGKWFEPRGRTPSTHIIKPAIPWLDGQVENEHFCLSLASELGLPAAHSDVVEIAGTPNIVVQRYDRQRRKGSRLLELTEDGGTVVRIHQEDMCQAHGVDPKDKYQADGGPGMKKIMALLAGSGSPAVDRGRFMRACLLNFLILGTDAHAKNFSLLIEAGRYRLAPLYDVISLLPYENEVLNSRVLAMSVGSQNKWRMIRLSHWRKAAEETGYPGDEVVGALTDLLERMPDVALSLRQRCQENGLRTPVLTRLADAIAKRCAEVRKGYGL
jgi:serine/threonine-protein kinase HipA